MSIPNEALQKLAQEIESRALQAEQAIGGVKAQIAAKQRDGRLLQLTTSEVRSLPTGTNVYEGVGKMFVLSPTADVETRLADETKGLKSDVSNLEKKLHYLETTHKNSREHIDKMFDAGRRG
ncbi:MAG: hypothetical protein M1832_004923 [Thelocarpon impressellum]|nr:MAG: hypothetical protein M1832_004923 [Thelocarpon impressellum]